MPLCSFILCRHLEQIDIEVFELTFTMDKVIQAVFCFLLQSTMQCLLQASLLLDTACYIQLMQVFTRCSCWTYRDLFGGLVFTYLFQGKLFSKATLRSCVTRLGEDEQRLFFSPVAQIG
ncbi:uncharacterized protein LOC120115111 isoform X1 [Hibiscus syriacus]|uniref:uncharacterized protein LOC120115111 isoform X1 n=1 Tax=Hibiscus syriacus TaxID=106335 RepID=UPI001922427B|nr:uncharacterized protein LOC120115111 isoform X1 [Hibiscus syriacus]